jgi:hypothetical protein
MTIDLDSADFNIHETENIIENKAEIKNVQHPQLCPLTLQTPS